MNGHSMSDKHGLLMILGCLIPLAAVLAVSVFGVPLNGLATFALVLLCPLMHLLMMRGMHGHSSQGQPSSHGSKEPPVRSLPAKEA